MEQVALEAKLRTSLGTTAANTLRRQGWIPGIVYGKGHPPRAVMVEARQLSKALHTKAGENVLVNLHIGDGEPQPEGAKASAKGKPGRGTTAIVKDVQHHPVDGSMRHVDFHQISLTETIRINVPVVATGEPIGVKQDGGVLEYLLREIEVECLPTQIPERLTLEVSALKIGDSLYVKHLVLPAGVTLHMDPQAPVLSVLAIKEEKVEEAVPGAEAAEPEVLKQKKPEELEAEAAAKAAEKTEKKEKAEPAKKE